MKIMRLQVFIYNKLYFCIVYRLIFYIEFRTIGINSSDIYTQEMRNIIINKYVDILSIPRMLYCKII